MHNWFCQVKKTIHACIVFNVAPVVRKVFLLIRFVTFNLYAGISMEINSVSVNKNPNGSADEMESEHFWHSLRFNVEKAFEIRDIPRRCSLTNFWLICRGQSPISILQVVEPVELPSRVLGESYLSGRWSFGPSTLVLFGWKQSYFIFVTRMFHVWWSERIASMATVMAVPVS